MRMLVSGTVCSILLVSGCSSGSHAGAGASEPRATATVTTTVTATPSTPPGPLQLGQAAQYKWGSVTALKTKASITPDDSLPGSKTWMGVLVRTCVTGLKKHKQITLGWDAWTVSDRQGGQYEAFAWTNVPQYPSPVFPMGRTVPPGQCVKGWIVFNKPANVRPVQANYGPSGEDAVVWKF